MDIEKNLRELNVKDASLLHAIGKLRVAAWSRNITVGNVPGDEWIDEFDSDARHFGIYDGEQLIAAARFSVHVAIEDVPESDVYRGVFQSPLKAPVASLNRLVTHPDYRGLGCTFYLDRVRLQKAKEMGCTCAILHVGDERIEHLERLGFLYCGRGKDYPPDHLLFDSGPNFVLQRPLEGRGDETWEL